MRVLITGGSTRVMIDKVRCVGNIFRGRTATDIARHFSSQQNCIVHVIGNREMSADMTYQSFGQYRTYDELYDMMKRNIGDCEYDAIIHSAAVSDYRVSDVLNADMESIKSGKVPSGEGKMYLEMVPTEKIVDQIRGWGFKGVLVKFKLQVDMTISELISVAKKSRETSDAEFIVANCLEWAKDSAIIIDRHDNEALVKRDNLPRYLYKRVNTLVNP